MKRLSWKLMLGLGLLSVSAVALLWFYQVFFLETQYVDQKIERTVQEVRALYETTDDQDFSRKNEALTELAERHHLSLERLSPEGEVLFRTDDLWRREGWMMGRARHQDQVFEAALGQEIMVLETGHPRLRLSYLLVGIPVVSGNTVGEVVVVSMPMEPIEETVALLQEQLYWVSGLMLGLTLLIGLWLTRLIVRPIRRLTGAAQRVARGELDTRLAVHTKDELGQLTEAFNTMTEELGQVENLRRELIANVSHDLRTPLSLIEGYAETIRDLSASQPEKRRQHAEIIREESRRLSRMVDDMLNLASLEAGHARINPQRIDLARLVRRMVDVMKGTAEQRNIRMDSQLQGPAWVWADPQRMEQVFINLLTNALHHTPEGGWVHVTLERMQSRVRVQVIDSGDGISAQDLPRIWERYYRAATHRPGQATTGSGLGLAIVREVIKAHGGSCGAMNDRVGGALFWVELEENKAGSDEDLAVKSGIKQERTISPSNESEDKASERTDT